MGGRDLRFRTAFWLILGLVGCMFEELEGVEFRVYLVFTEWMRDGDGGVATKRGR